MNSLPSPVVFLCKALLILGSAVFWIGGAEKLIADPLGVTVSGLDSSYERSYLIESNPQREMLQVNVSALVERSQRLVLPANVNLRYVLTLTEGADGSGVQVMQERFSFRYLVAGNYSQIHSEVLELDPPGFLDDAVDHHLLVEVFHIEDPAVGTYGLDDTDTIVNRLGHFSGVLNFGAIATTMLELSEEPGLLFNAWWQLTIADGVIDSSGFHYMARTPIGIPQAISAVRDDTTGDLSININRVAVLADSSDVDWGVWTGVEAGRIEMSEDGIVAGGLVIPLPDGVGWRVGNAGTLSPSFSGGSASVPLDEQLVLIGSGGGELLAGAEFISDCYPVAFTPNSWSFGPVSFTLSSPGTSFLRQEIYDQWSNSPGQDKPDSNDGYFCGLAGSAGTALVLTPDGVSTQLEFGTNGYFSHFPLASNQHGAGNMVVEDNEIIPAVSQLAPFESFILYGSGCRTGPDPNAIPQRKRKYLLSASSATFAPGGGLHAAGAIAAAVPPPPNEEYPQIQNLEVGGTAAGDPVHEVLVTTSGEFYMPGPLVLDASTDDGAMRHLLNGLLPDSDFDFERTGTPAYIHDGLGKYAGLNFEHAPGLQIVSRLGGAGSPPYPASECFRGHVRICGFFGVIAEDPNAPLSTLSLLGFDVDFDSFGFGYLANNVQTSLADGRITTPYPTDLTVEFEDLMLNCCGNPTTFTLIGPSTHELPYWNNSKVDLLSVAFDTGLDECNTSNATLRIGVNANINHLPGKHTGYLHVTPAGHLGYYQDAVANESYLSLKKDLTLSGFRYMPTRDAFFNAYEEDDTAPDSGAGAGRINLVGELDWAFFNNGEIHAHVHGQESPFGDDDFGPIGIKGGWSQGASNYFNDPVFDKAHRGFPTGGGATLASYMEENEQHLVKADSNAWVGLLDYDVEWSPVLKLFRSPQEKGQNLLVVDLQSKVRRLQENTAHLEFNAEFGGLASVGLKSLLEDTLDDAAGYVSSQVVGDVEEELNDGVESLSQLLNDEIAVLLQQSLGPLLDEQFINGGLVNIHSAGYTEDSIDEKFNELPAVLQQMATFESGLENALNVAERIQERLEKIKGLLGAINTLTDVNQIGGLIQAVAGEIDLPIPEIELSNDAIMQIAAEAQNGLSGNGELAQFGSWLAEVRVVILEIETVICEIQDLLEDGQEFANEIQNVISQADFDGLRGDVKDDVNAYLDATVRAAGTQAGDYSPAEIDDAIRAMIRDRMYELDFSAQLHNVLKRWIEPVTDAVDLAVQEALNAVTAAIIDAAAPYLQSVDDAIASFTGFGQAVKSARLRGDAIIVGDRLKKLQLAGTAVITPVEPTEIQVDALFQWCEYRSDGTSICDGDVGDLNRSISIFATGAPVKAGFPLGNRVSIGAKFTLPENDLPGMSGFFELEQGGSFPAEAFRINNFNANLGFGGPQTVAYVSAYVDASFGIWDMTGGICIGRVCDVEPLGFYEGVEELPGYSVPLAQPRTGLLVYATGKYNLIDLGCLVEASVGAGVGSYFFLLDDGTREYGGRIDGNASGKALCLIKVNGSVELVGGKTGDTYFFDGEACLKGKVGIGKLSKKFERCIGTEYRTGQGWSVDY